MDPQTSSCMPPSLFSLPPRVLGLIISPPPPPRPPSLQSCLERGSGWPNGSCRTGDSRPQALFCRLSRPQEGTGGSGMATDRVKNLQSEVEGVKNIMSQNVERILARGENLDHLRNKTEDLEATSEHFKTTSQKVARKYWWKNIKMIAIICVIVAIIIILLIILFATNVIPT
ncbi:LOW QUALITY PROTEIN: vesicle-associated membrane protein 8 [Dermochelys coriacea]|uniref:LOW QUALITY PROTEIN: vesicle-associated membrane protein 8 n=1 Tax=Dermochelys coriacea TaxID=27794 RepID=UPI001CA862FC|nr:LOW QUALITY PROTEIN: vesicle-associated membrane protein 8 [Dermochelys coriacea]